MLEINHFGLQNDIKMPVKSLAIDFHTKHPSNSIGFITFLFRLNTPSLVLLPFPPPTFLSTYDTTALVKRMP